MRTPAQADPVSKVLDSDNLLIKMMDPAPISQRAYVDAKMLRCSATQDDPVSKVLDDDNASSWLVPVMPLDDENLLQEILLRLPPQPSSLPRASLVCKRWQSILSDPEFFKRFLKHHRKPPLLGFFAWTLGMQYNFIPFLDTKPDRIPSERFVVPKSSNSEDNWNFLDCRHGLAVLIHQLGREVVVWDPLTGQQHRLSFPPELCNIEREIFWSWHAAVLCADAEERHVHGDCFSSPFKLVLLCARETQAFACLYESVTGVWGNIVSTLTTAAIFWMRPSVLIGNALCWLVSGGDILAFDIDRQTLSGIEKPTDAHHTGLSFQLWRTTDGCGLGLAVISELGIHLWERKMNSEGVFEWVLQPKIIELEGLFPRGMRSDHKSTAMVGYDEESNVIVLATFIGDFMLQLEPMQFRRISERNWWDNKTHYPYRNFYSAGRGVGWKLVDQKR